MNLHYKVNGDDFSVAGENSSKVKKTLKQLGFNVDFAPVADVITNEKNNVISFKSAIIYELLYTLSIYVHVRVSIFIISPIFINIGT